jgi:hypothetical protein
LSLRLEVEETVYPLYALWARPCPSGGSGFLIYCDKDLETPLGGFFPDSDVKFIYPEFLLHHAPCRRQEEQGKEGKEEGSEELWATKIAVLEGSRLSCPTAFYVDHNNLVTMNCSGYAVFVFAIPSTFWESEIFEGEGGADRKLATFWLGPLYLFVATSTRPGDDPRPSMTEMIGCTETVLMVATRENGAVTVFDFSPLPHQV